MSNGPFHILIALLEIAPQAFPSVPRQRCVAQRIEIIMIAGGNHTTI